MEKPKLSREAADKERLSGLEFMLRVLPAITVLVTVLGFVFTVWQYRSEQNKNRIAALQQSEKDNETAQRAYMKPLLEKQQQLYFEAATAAATIASTHDPVERRKAEANFWVLYWGPLVMVEGQDVSGAMKRFGNCLSGADKCNDEVLKQRSLALASTLEASMLKTWNAKPEDFTKNQFSYR